MELKEAIKVYNEFRKNENIKKYYEALEVIVPELNRKAERVYYKSSNKYNYFIEQPCEEMILTDNGVEYRKHSYNGIGIVNGNKDYSLNFCLSLCNKTEDEIKKRIDEHIIEDNEQTI